MKRAMITGVTGQDGSYLAELLLAKGYEVHGVKRRASSFNTERIDHLYIDPLTRHTDFYLHYGDLTDSTNLIRLVGEVQPDEIYNLAAQSHVKVSFETAEYTGNADGLGTLRLLEAVRLLGLAGRVRFYQASTSEMFGQAAEAPQRESTPFHPRSPYGAAKVYGFWITVNYREAYGMYACNGILFNHESPRRGETFVSRKITRAAARIALGLQPALYLGNLGARRDWGHARDYVDAMWRMLQIPEPEDFVIATGESRSVREFAAAAFAELGVSLEWRGAGREEEGVVAAVDEEAFAQALNSGAGAGQANIEHRTSNIEHRTSNSNPQSEHGEITTKAQRTQRDIQIANPQVSLRAGDFVVRIDPKYYRPAEVDFLLGDATRAREKLGWAPTVRFGELVREMVGHDLAEAIRDLHLLQGGFSVRQARE